MTPVRQILIIEDNADDQLLLMRQLKRAGLGQHIKIITDGGEALAFLTDERFKREDLAAIFLDLKLPKVSGLRLLEAIRSDLKIIDIPVVVMTSSNEPHDLEECRHLGVYSFVPKPLTFSSFAKAFADTFQARFNPALTREGMHLAA
jgi:two-component system response regulator